MSKHTPGPWTSGHHGNVALWVGPSHLDRTVALVPWDTHAEARDEARDNARLIAAAPDLLEALKAACGYLMNARIDLETGATKKTAIQTIDGGLKLVRDAIAKAEGQ